MSASPFSPEFFEKKYRRESDPWHFANSPYEQHRYDATLAALSHRRYARAFEPGCSVGVLTERLARVSDAVEAIDFSPTAVEQARTRCAHLPGVSVRCLSLPERLPVQGFDLVVLSEIGYYFSPAHWTELVASVAEGLPRGGTLLGVHWLGSSGDHRMHGHEVHRILRAQPGLLLEHEEQHPFFRLDRWVRA